MELNTEAEIAAPRERIWDILVDFARYPEWNPFLVDVQGELGIGRELQVHAGSSEGRRYRFKPRISIIDPDRELRWQAHFMAKGLLHGEQFFVLKELSTDRTRLIHGGAFTGLLLKYMGGFLTDTARGFVGMNQALKQRAEKRGL